MDLLFHIFVGILISKFFLNSYYLLPVVFSLLPDLIGMSFEINKIRKSSKKSYKHFIKDFVKYSKQNFFFNKFERITYKSSHNLFAWFFASLLAYFIFPEYFFVLSLAYFSHLFFDSYTHEGEFSLQPFYPFSKISFSGKNWVSDKKTFKFSWTILILLTIYVYFV